MINPTYWRKQNEEPLFPDIIWSKPENKQQAGKLLIIGGHAHGFSAPAIAYQSAVQAGAGTVRVLIPDQIRKQLSSSMGPSLEVAYGPSTPSGSFASKSLAEMLDNSRWADAALLSGDLGRNSETAIVLEKLVSKTEIPITITKDAVDYFTSQPATVLDRPRTVMVLTIAQLQKLVSNAKFTIAVTYGMDLVRLVDVLHEFTQLHPLGFVVKHHDNFVVAVNGNVSTSRTNADLEDLWRVPTASRIAVWWLQNTSKPFEAMTSAVYGL